MNTAKKRVAIAVISLLSMLMLAMSNEDVRASMLQWCENVYKEYIHYYFEGETTKKIEHVYKLTMVPDGFEVVYEYADAESVTICYEDEDGNYIEFMQYTTEEFGIYVDNEKGDWSTIVINNQEVKVFDYTTKMGAMWIEDGYYMLLIYHGCDDMEIVKEMVETMR